MQTLLARCRAEIRRGVQGQAIAERVPEEREPVLEQARRPARSRSVEVAREGRRAQKLDRYEQMRELHQQGVKVADIASRMGIAKRTIHHWRATWLFVHQPERLDEAQQRYTCLEVTPTGGRYRFESLEQGVSVFLAELPVDQDGLVVEYPGLFRRAGTW